MKNVKRRSASLRDAPLSPKRLLRKLLRKLRAHSGAQPDHTPADRRELNIEIYRVARQLFRSEERETYARLLGAMDPTEARIETFVDLVFDNVPGVTRKLAAKHKNAMRYAAAKKVKAADLADFLAASGGYNGAAAKLAELRRA